MTRVGATEFKAKCLELMDRVAERRESYEITKRGRPVARLVPAEAPAPRSVLGCMTGEMEVVGDLGRPAWSDEEWRELAGERAARRRAWEREWRTRGTSSGKKTAGQPPRRSRR